MHVWNQYGVVSGNEPTIVVLQPDGERRLPRANPRGRVTCRCAVQLICVMQQEAKSRCALCVQVMCTCTLCISICAYVVHA